MFTEKISNKILIIFAKWLSKVHGGAQQNLFYTSINAYEVLPQVHIALILAFALIETIPELHEVGKTLFVQTLFKTGLLLSFSVGRPFDTLLELFVKAIVSSLPQKLLLIVIKILYLLLKA